MVDSCCCFRPLMVALGACGAAAPAPARAAPRGGDRRPRDRRRGGVRWSATSPRPIVAAASGRAGSGRGAHDGAQEAASPARGRALRRPERGARHLAQLREVRAGPHPTPGDRRGVLLLRPRAARARGLREADVQQHAQRLRLQTAWRAGGDESSSPTFFPDPASLASHLAARRAVAFPAVHGTFGEDGSLQTVLEEAGVPFVGAGAGAAGAAFDKALCASALAAAGFPTLRAALLEAHHGSSPSRHDVLKKLTAWFTDEGLDLERAWVVVKLAAADRASASRRRAASTKPPTPPSRCSATPRFPKPLRFGKQVIRLACSSSATPAAARSSRWWS